MRDAHVRLIRSSTCYDGLMSEDELICSQCGKASVWFDDSGNCADCHEANQATILPTPNRAADATILPGQTNPQTLAATEIGDYDLIEEIARGGMGVVYKANHRNLNRVSAVKMILGGRFSSREELQQAMAKTSLKRMALKAVFVQR